MQKAVDRLIAAYRSQEKVCVYADFDLDGTSGLALLWEGLEKLGFKNVTGYQPKRLSEGYGFHASAVEELAREGVTVIITVDVGITAFKAGETARELGVDVILTDHHLPLDHLPKVFTLINPNQGDCPSGLGYLCGAGVAFYLLRALKRGLVDAGLVSEESLPLRELLDFLTIATLTDMVPLVKDNRPLVRVGLSQLSITQRPGLQLLLENLGLSGKVLTSQDVGIKFAPKLNALSRMEAGLRPIDLMRASHRDIASSMVAQVMENNSTRVELQGQGDVRARELILARSFEKFIFVNHDEFHRGVVGLIATKLASEFNLPAFVGARGADGFVVGSGRLPSGSDLNLLDILGSVSDHMTRFGGHAGAAGFEFHHDQFESILTGLISFFSEQEARPLKATVFYDLDVTTAELDSTFMKWLESLGPFGQGFPPPLFRLSQVKVKERKILRGGHLKLWIENEKGQSLEALYFSPPKNLAEEKFQKGTFADLLVELQWNDFNGQRTLQLLVRDLQNSRTENPIERGLQL